MIEQSTQENSQESKEKTSEMEQVMEQAMEQATEQEVSSEEVPKELSAVKDIPIEDGEDGLRLMQESLAQVVRPINYDVGQKVRCSIVAFSGDSVFLDLGQKSEASIPRIELEEDEPLEVGQQIEAYVLRSGGSEITLGKQLSLDKGEDALIALEEAFHNQIPLEGRVTGRNKGGLDVEVYGKRAFCPISQIEIRFCENPDQYLDQTLTFRITELKEKGRQIVLSRRSLLEEANEAVASKVREKIEEGAIFEGTVRSVTNFGAFVDIGGNIEGLVHVSELSYDRVEDPSTLLSSGQKLRVQVIKYQPSKNRLSLSVKSLASDPWEEAASQFAEGKDVDGTVVRMESFGAFVSLAPGIDGLIHVSELSYKRIKHPSDVLNIGDKIRVRIVKYELEKKRIGLSLKAMESSPYQDDLQIREGDIVVGKVENIEGFGLFIRLPNGKTGLVPNGEMGTPRNSDHAKMFSNGDEMKVLVLRIDENNKIRLSRKAADAEEGRRDEQSNLKSFQEKQGGSQVFGTFGDLFKNIKGKK